MTGFLSCCEVSEGYTHSVSEDKRSAWSMGGAWTEVSDSSVGRTLLRPSVMNRIRNV